MLWRLIYRRLLQSHLERDLSESRYIRRLAQLTVYQLTKISDWGNKHFLTETSFPHRLRRFLKAFQDNLEKEIEEQHKKPQ